MEVPWSTQRYGTATNFKITICCALKALFCPRLSVGAVEYGARVSPAKSVSKLSDEYEMNIVDIFHPQQEAVILEQLSNRPLYKYSRVPWRVNNAIAPRGFHERGHAVEWFISQEDLTRFRRTMSRR
jgi:hypothetical protein